MPYWNPKRLSIFLGVLIFLFGLLKFFQPFSGWFEVQIQGSGLPHQAILIGKLGEMAVGVLFLTPWLPGLLDGTRKTQLLMLACFGLAVEMLVATYVHLQPGVPADVLPLKIKPPVMPLFVLALALINAVAVWKRRPKGSE